MVERSKRIELRVTADELRQIHERMQEAGISSLTAYMIRMALHGYVIVMDLSDLKEVLRLLQISGNNLNQYAKKANETDRYVVNMPWKEKRDFFERMARYVLRILNNTEKGE